MADLLPSSPDPSAGDGGDPRVIGVDSEDAADLLSALQSETAREILAALYDEPATPSALAETADTSIQNVRYHLEKLTDADLVEVADTVYSEKGREMNVYAPAAKPLVVFAGNDDDTEGVENALSRLLGGLGVLGASSLLVQRLFGASTGGDSGTYEMSDDSGADPNAGVNTSGQSGEFTGVEEDGASGTTLDAGDDAATVTESDATEAATEEPGTVTEFTEESETVTTVAEDADSATTVAEQTTQYATEAADGGADALAALPPGLLFFLGGAVVLLAVGVAWHLRAK